MNPPLDVWCWFHSFDHPFDGVSDGWMCHAWEPRVEADGALRVGPVVSA